MKLKQVVSILAATVLPLLALSAYLFLSPVPATALTCPEGQIDAHYGCTNGACNVGYGSCMRGTGPYIYCYPYDGICNNGCVECLTE